MDLEACQPVPGVQIRERGTKKIKKVGSLRGLSVTRAVLCPEAGWSKWRPPDIPDISDTHFPFFFSSERNTVVPYYLSSIGKMVARLTV